MAIRILEPGVVDRIAAGEVLDRPANLVKELIENSLDAGATEIDVEFAGGGRQVVIRDNGLGMSPEDLFLSLRRHATSKIVRSEDLFQLHSYGFRGEALASIAAVSRLTLNSRLRGAEQGYRVVSEFGEAGAPAPVSTREGTEIRVEQLFENVPARLKFLKSESSEHTWIKTTLKALGLAHEKVGFNVRSQGELLYHWPRNQDFKARAEMILQNKSLFAGAYELDGMRAEILVSAPDQTQHLNRNLWFFVQGRWVQDRSLTAAVMEAHRNLLMHGQYPTAVVRLNVPLEAVDVNVHPTKSQVKFRDAQQAFRVTSRAIREVLEQSPWLSSKVNSQAPVLTPNPSSPSQPNYGFQGGEFARTQYQTKSFPVGRVREALQEFQISETNPEVFRWADLQIIGQFNQTYIVAQASDALYLVDQHAAHERVVFERLMESFKVGAIEVQNLLLPLVFDFSVEEVEVLLTHRETVEKLGLCLERMGPSSVAVQAIPTIVKESAVSEALQHLAFELSENVGELAWEKTVGAVFASLACHSVVRAGQSLSAEEMRSLLVQMDHYPLSSFCPHGRPVFNKRRVVDIDREFGRIP